jgi:hypothetical protein
MDYAYRDEGVGVFVRFSCAASQADGYNPLATRKTWLERQPEFSQTATVADKPVVRSIADSWPLETAR